MALTRFVGRRQSAKATTQAVRAAIRDQRPCSSVWPAAFWYTAAPKPNDEDDAMPISKRVLLATATAAGLSAVVGARAQTPSMSKSTRVARIEEGEAIKVYPQTGGVHKSNTKVSAEKHLAALRKGAREISKNTVIYKQGGKMYMYDYQDEANTEAAENFQSQFDNDY
jgi:hypothetical protein